MTAIALKRLDSGCPSGYLSITSMSARNLPNPERLLFVLKAYLDGSSGKREADASEMITLGGLVASTSVWREIEAQWIELFRHHPELKRGLHMTDAMGLHRDYRNWTNVQVNKLVGQCVDLLASFRKRHLYLKACTIDLRDYWKFAKEVLNIKAPEAICVDMCCGSGLPVDEEAPDKEFPDLEMYFDIKEDFRKHIQENWEWLKARNDPGWSKQVKQITTAVASETPALQAADLISWTTNAHYRGVERAQDIYNELKFSLVRLDAFYDYDRLVSQFDENAQHH